jgi:hypothetical protein
MISPICLLKRDDTCLCVFICVYLLFDSGDSIISYVFIACLTAEIVSNASHRQPSQCSTPACWAAQLHGNDCMSGLILSNKDWALRIWDSYRSNSFLSFLVIILGIIPITGHLSSQPDQ